MKRATSRVMASRLCRVPHPRHLYNLQGLTARRHFSLSSTSATSATSATSRSSPEGNASDAYAWRVILRSSILERNLDRTIAQLSSPLAVSLHATGAEDAGISGVESELDRVEIGPSASLSLAECVELIVASYRDDCDSNNIINGKSTSNSNRRRVIEPLAGYSRLLSSLPRIGLTYDLAPGPYQKLIDLIALYNPDKELATSSVAATTSKFKSSRGALRAEPSSALTRAEISILYATLSDQGIDLSSNLSDAALSRFFSNTLAISVSSTNNTISQTFSLDDASHFMRLARQASSSIRWSNLPTHTTNKLLEPIASYQLGSLSSTSGAYTIDDLTSYLCYLHYLHLSPPSLKDISLQKAIMHASIDCLQELNLYRRNGMIPWDIFNNLSHSLISLVTRKALRDSISEEGVSTFNALVEELFRGANAATIGPLLRLWCNNSSNISGNSVNNDGIGVSPSNVNFDSGWSNVDANTRRRMLAALVGLSNSGNSRSSSSSSSSRSSRSSSGSSSSSGGTSGEMSLAQCETTLRALQDLQPRDVDPGEELELMTAFLANVSERLLCEGKDMSTFVSIQSGICEILYQSKYKLKADNRNSSNSSSRRLMTCLLESTSRIAASGKADLIAVAVNSLSQLALSGVGSTSLSDNENFASNLAQSFSDSSIGLGFKMLLLSSNISSSLERSKDFSFSQLVHGLDRLGISIYDMSLPTGSTSTISERVKSLKLSSKLTNFLRKTNDLKTTSLESQQLDSSLDKFTDVPLDVQVELLVRSKSISDLGLNLSQRYHHKGNGGGEEIYDENTVQKRNGTTFDVEVESSMPPKGMLSLLSNIDRLTLPQFIQVTNSLGGLKVDVGYLPPHVVEKIFQRKVNSISSLFGLSQQSIMNNNTNSKSNSKTNPRYAFSVLAGYFTCLRRMNVKWHQLGGEFQSQAYRACQLVADSDIKCLVEASNVIFSMSRMEMDYEELSYDQKKILENLILAALRYPDSDKNSGNSNSNSKGGSDRVNASAIEHVANPQAIYMLLNGMGGIGFTHPHMSVRLRSALLANVEASIRLLGSMASPVPNTRSADVNSNSNNNASINNNVEANASRSKRQGRRDLSPANLCQMVSATTRALASAEFNSMDLLPELSHSLLECISDLEPRLYSDPIGVADVIFGLGTMNFRWWRLESRHQDTLVNAFVETHLSMSSQQLTNCLQGFGRMQLPIEWVSPGLLHALNEASLKVMNAGIGLRNSNSNSNSRDKLATSDALRVKLNESCMAWTSLIYGLRKMSCNWDQLTPEFQMAYSACFVHFAPSTMLPVAVSSHLYCLGAMHANWKDLDEELQRSVFLSLSRTIDDMSHQQISNTLSGLNGMRCVWLRIPLELRRKLAARACGLAAHLVATIQLGQQTRNNDRISNSNRNMDGFDEYEESENTERGGEEDEEDQHQLQEEGEDHPMSRIYASKNRHSINQLKSSFVFTVSAMGGLGYTKASLEKELKSSLPSNPSLEPQEQEPEQEQYHDVERECMLSLVTTAIVVARPFFTSTDEKNLRKACRALKCVYPSAPAEKCP